jgi:hypothetical protein
MSNTQVIIKHVHAFAVTTVRSDITGQQPLQLPGGAEPIGHGLNKRAQIRWIQLYELKFAEGSEILVNLHT